MHTHKSLIEKIVGQPIKETGVVPFTVLMVAIILITFLLRIFL